MPTNVKIDRGVAFDGAAIVQGGIENYAILINHEDLTNGVITEDAISHEIETITLDSGTYGYKFESSKGSVQIIPGSPLRGVSAIDGFDHTLDMRVIDATQLSVENATRTRFQKVAVLVPLVSGKALLYGRRVGMRMSDFQMMPGDADTGGTFQMVIKTPDNDPPEIAAPQLVESTFDILSLLAS
jgi:hypothetical protein